MKKLIGISALLFPLNFYSQNIIDVYCSEDSCSHTLIDPEMLFIERWDTLPQSKFWKTVINTSKDTCLINIASTREISDQTTDDKFLKIVKNITSKGFVRSNLEEKLVDLSDVRINLKTKN